MKRLIYFLIALSVLMFACNISTPAGTPPAGITQPSVTAAVTPVEATNPPPAPQVNVNCNKVSLYLDPALASGYDCQTISEASGGDMPAFAVNPEFTEITLTGYSLPGSVLGPKIDLFPVQRFVEILPDTVPGRVSDLQALIAGGAPSADHLPILPILNAAQIFHAAYGVIPFVSGRGIRFLTMYGQDVGPVNNQAMVYTYQGLTSDGKFWVTVTLPASNPILPADGSILPGGETWDQFSANFSTYIVDIQNQLNAQAPGAYSPTLTALDALVASITVQP
jgi:hypothetical protein